MTEAKALERRWTVPNVLSFGRLGLIPVFLYLIVTRRDTAAFTVTAIIGVSDFLDGFLARRLGQVSQLGKLIDPLADRVAVVAALAALAIRGVVPIWLASVIILRDLIVAVVFGFLEARGVPRLEVNIVGKGATAAIFAGSGLGVLGLAAAGAIYLRGAALALVALGGVLYWVAGAIYASAALTWLRRGSIQRDDQEES